MSQRGSPERGSLAAAAEESATLPRRRAVLFLRGAVAASTLGAYTVAAAVGAFLALLPAAVRRAPRGRAALAPSADGELSSDAAREPLAG